MLGGTGSTTSEVSVAKFHGCEEFNDEGLQGGKGENQERSPIFQTVFYDFHGMRIEVFRL